MAHKEKEQRVAEFVNQYIASIGGSSDTEPRVLTIIAKSPASPVARAVEQSFAGLLRAAVDVRAIFAEREPEGRMQRWLEVASAVAWSRDARLAEAHEQLVLGRSQCWLGDAMRREADKSDLYERYVAGCPRSAALAQTSFDLLLAHCVPVSVRRITGSLKGRPAVPVVATDAAAAGDPASPTADSTRH